jgi:phenylacetate-CoA ligase
MYRWLVRNVLFPLQERAKGHPTMRILKEMLAVEQLTGPEVEELRAVRLRDFIRYAHSHVPYIHERMQEAGVQPADINGPADLARLPITTKSDIRMNRERLRSRLATGLIPFSTGGSTGAPLIFDLSRERIAATMACRQRVMRWWNLSVGDPEFTLWGSPIEVTRQDRFRNLRDRLLRTKLFSAFDMSPAVMSQYLNLLEKGGYRTIFAYPSSIYLLCLHARRNKKGLRVIGMKTVFVTGEVLFPYQRELISEVLNCPVADGYGGRESGFIAHECPQGGMHIMADATIVETVDSDGRAVAEGQPGEIVVTDLYSRQAPFLRYATGDIGVLSSRRCSCGRPLPLLEKIEGRTTDFVIAPDGTILHALSVIYILREIEGIEQFRVRQSAISSFRVQIVRNQRYQAESESRIRDGLRRRLRAPVEVEIEYLASLPADASGKFRQVISELDMNQVTASR